MNTLYTFYDYNGQEVELSFVRNYFSEDPKHVWVVCEFENKWLLTSHPKRGYEFPGGKVEKGETPEEAAYREVYEETGATIQELYYIGQYKVHGDQGEYIIKNIYFATISKLNEARHFYETDGPIIFSCLPENINENASFSFIMKDRVLELTLRKIEECHNSKK